MVRFTTKILSARGKLAPALTGAGLCVAGTSPFALDATPAKAYAPSHSYDIPAGPMADALNRLADKSGAQLAYDAGLARRRQTRGVSGKRSLPEALNELLSGTDLTYKIDPTGQSVSILLAENDTGTRSDARGARALPTIEIGARTRRVARGAGAPRSSGVSPVTARAEAPKSYWQQLAEKAKIPEGSYVAPYSSTGTKIPTPFMETPLDVQVVTPQQLRDRQVTTIPDAVKYVSGVVTRPTVDNFSGGSGIFIRGFLANTSLRNGFRSEGFLSGAGQGLANVESVEVLKGSSAILYGLVEPGGMINVITKQPQDKPSYSVQQQIGSFDFYRTTVGATGPVTGDKSLLYRVDMSYESAGSFIDRVRTNNLFFAPVVRWNISPSTQATFELQYTKATDGGAVALVPTYEGVPIPMRRTRNYGDYSPFKNEELLAGVNWSHALDNDWMFKHQIQYVTRNVSNRTIYPSGTRQLEDGRVVVDRIFDGSGLGANSGVGRIIDQVSTQANLMGRINTGVLEHKILLGADFYRYHIGYLGEKYFPFGSVDAFNAQPVLPPDGSFLSFVGKSVSNNYHFGTFVQDQIKLPFDIHLLGGVRYQNFRTNSKTTGSCLLGGPDPDPGCASVFGGAFTPADPIPVAQRVTPRVAALWRPQEWLSIYSNYAEGFGANEGLIYPSRPVPPTDARQWEVGGKVELLDGKLRANFAYFNITQTNVPTSDLAHPGFFLITGDVNSKGPELDIQGELLPGWNVTIAYSNTDARITKSNDTNAAGVSVVGDRFPGIPRNQASFFSTYEFKQGDWKGLKFGGGVSYQDARLLSNFTNISRPPPSLPQFTTVDLMASYVFIVGSTTWTAQLNASNLFDLRYYDSGWKYSEPGYGWYNDYLVPGIPRRILGSISTSF